jgi:GNAT superfamily N-acetyltransferase
MDPAAPEGKGYYTIRPAAVSNAAALTRVAKASKRYWNYPDAYYDIWEEELTITWEYIAKNTVFAVETVSGEVIAFYAVVKLDQDLRFRAMVLEKGVWLDHMFITPARIGQGLGRLMFTHLSQWCRAEAVPGLRLLADPHAKGFYEKMGCRYIKEVPSTIAGRTTPMYELLISGPADL